MNSFTESFLGGLLGPAGAWTVRLLTLNRCRLDPESWSAIRLGGALLVGAIVFGAL
jgi:hypothetical protein